MQQNGTGDEIPIELFKLQRYIKIGSVASYFHVLTVELEPQRPPRSPGTDRGLLMAVIMTAFTSSGTDGLACSLSSETRTPVCAAPRARRRARPRAGAAGSAAPARKVCRCGSLQEDRDAGGPAAAAGAGALLGQDRLLFLSAGRLVFIKMYLNAALSGTHRGRRDMFARGRAGSAGTNLFSHGAAAAAPTHPSSNAVRCVGRASVYNKKINIHALLSIQTFDHAPDLPHALQIERYRIHDKFQRQIGDALAEEQRGPAAARAGRALAPPAAGSSTTTWARLERPALVS
ncbi:hypothetical protein EVAR_9294_1 [Eumeta japonica]|uniref:Uncharacterized protein n=1 Tax=Eumeta variegata TaxID=151549 RepID=A0A4C1TMM1_EUMVA|nr:hypothetical protein EVAR_9294_1 [Eumeta japonica]